jgi:GNAT superfamily N-acetyltransferase
MKLKVVPLESEHLEDAAALAIHRYRMLRQLVPLLPLRYEDMNTIVAMLSGVVEQAPAVVALCDDRVVGFLTGSLIPVFRGRRAVFSPEWANGAALDDSRRVYEEMYARLSASWVRNGCFTHLISLLPHDRDGMQAWHWLGFGMIATDGLRGLEPVQGQGADVRIRRAGTPDVQEVALLDEALDRYMASAPTFLPFVERHNRKYYDNSVANPANALWLAYRDKEAVAFMAAGPASSDACTIIRDEKTTSVTSAYTKEPLRGKGIATSLLNQSLMWARSEGYERCAVDFEPMNPLATRFWMRHFQPVSYTLVRQIDERVASEHVVR